MRIVKPKETTHGINGFDAEVLGYLSDHPNFTSAQLAEGLKQDKTLISMSLNRLIAANLVYPTKVIDIDPGDKTTFTYFKYMAL